MLQYFADTSEPHDGYSEVLMSCHQQHLLTLRQKSHKPHFRLVQLNYIMLFVLNWHGE